MPESKIICWLLAMFRLLSVMATAPLRVPPADRRKCNHNGAGRILRKRRATCGGQREVAASKNRVECQHGVAIVEQRNCLRRARGADILRPESE